MSVETLTSKKKVKIILLSTFYIIILSFISDLTQLNQRANNGLIKALNIPSDFIAEIFKGLQQFDNDRIAELEDKISTLENIIYEKDLVIKSLENSRSFNFPSKNYDGKTKFPLLLFLHGAGERGSNIEKVTVHGPPKLIKQGKQFPFIVISPQCPKGSRWDPDALNAMLDQIIKSHAVDETRIYCTGLSMGGFGTWALGSSNPNRFAAFAPICGGGVDRTAFVSFEMAKKPVWVFHGDADSVVPLKESERMVKALKRRGGKPKFTVYKGVNHDSWTETYNNPKLYEWFLSHKKIARK